MTKKTRYIIIIAIVAVLGGLIAWYRLTPGKYDTLATCLKDKQVKFYGAFWCPHCQATKKAFGKSAKLLPYTECSTPDGNGQLPVCTAASVVGYPTWEFPNPLTISASEKDTSVACKTPYTADQDKNCMGTREGSWLTMISGRAFISPSKPTLSNGAWNLPSLSRTSGEVPMELLSELSACPLK